MTTKFLKNLAIENHKGYYLQGHTTDGGEMEVAARIAISDAEEILKKSLPEGAPIIELYVSRNLLLRILACWVNDDDFLNVQIYGERKPIVIRGEEEFAILMPAVPEAVDAINIRREAGLEIGKPK